MGKNYIEYNIRDQKSDIIEKNRKTEGSKRNKRNKRNFIFLFVKIVIQGQHLKVHFFLLIFRPVFFYPLLKFII